jgi:hypothetical protein
MLDLEQGKYLVKLAREAIELYVRTGETKSPEMGDDWLTKHKGVFCTLNTHPSGELRGCIGLPYPDRPLVEAVIESAISSTQDPRFPPLTSGELDKITVELSILTVPEQIKVDKPEDCLFEIKRGRDGLILEYGPYRGLFLPQVWEQLPEPTQFLSNLCYKAGLFNPNAWKDREAKLFRFRAQIFREKDPHGEVEEE